MTDSSNEFLDFKSKFPKRNVNLKPNASRRSENAVAFAKYRNALNPEFVVLKLDEFVESDDSNKQLQAMIGGGQNWRDRHVPPRRNDDQKRVKVEFNVR